MKRQTFVAVTSLVLWCGAVRADESGLKVGVNADIVGQAGFGSNSSASQKLEVREAELFFSAPIDHLFDGVVSVAAHQESDGAKLEIHEVYLGSTKLIPRSRFRLGQFFLGVGRLNQTHRHDWPFTSEPKYHRMFFAAEAAIDSGAEYSWLTPLPFYLDVTAGVTSGFIFGHSHNSGARPIIPTHYLRATTFQGWGNGDGVQIALNYLGRKDASATRTSLFGIDTILKWKDSEQHKNFVQSEVWYRATESSGQTTLKELGAYIFPNFSLAEKLMLGVRIDYYSNLSLKNVVDESISNFEYAIVPTLSYQTSEFATFRASLKRTENRQSGTSVSSDWGAEVQAVFILGAHPAHDF